jgi:two-component system, chemotaxis family, CheB/CheR fusion protein
MSRQEPNFPIVGVGASAGGVEALEGLFQGMVDEPGLGIAILTHLNPERESLLHEIIARHTRLRVDVASDDVQEEATCVYVVPPDAVLGIENGRLKVHKLGAKRERRL